MNSQFYNWNKILLPYCDGACHQGFVAEPFNVFGQKLYFRGYNITMQSFNFIFQMTQIQNAQQVVLSGVSAGGLGVFYWGNYLKQLLVPSVPLLLLPDSGFFINYPVDGLFQKSIQTFAELAERSLIMP